MVDKHHSFVDFLANRVPHVPRSLLHVQRHCRRDFRVKTQLFPPVLLDPTSPDTGKIQINYADSVITQRIAAGHRSFISLYGGKLPVYLQLCLSDALFKMNDFRYFRTANFSIHLYHHHLLQSIGAECNPTVVQIHNINPARMSLLKNTAVSTLSVHCIGAIVSPDAGVSVSGSQANLRSLSVDTFIYLLLSSNSLLP